MQTAVFTKYGASKFEILAPDNVQQKISGNDYQNAVISAIIELNDEECKHLFVLAKECGLIGSMLDN